MPRLDSNTHPPSLTERSRNAAIKLGERYDRLNSLWEEAENLLRTSRVSRPVHVEFSDPDFSDLDPSLGEEYLCALGVDRVKGKWAICYTRYHGSERDEPHWGGPTDWYLITEAPAETRLQFWPYFERLYQKVVETAEEAVADYDKAIEEFGEVLAKLK